MKVKFSKEYGEHANLNLIPEWGDKYLSMSSNDGSVKSTIKLIACSALIMIGTKLAYGAIDQLILRYLFKGHESDNKNHRDE